ncbi:MULTISPECIES: nitrilase family protein [Parabacteroides]|uniref:nitrilase family protein n=1 Tax=Parabacteroides provencensis TaxID=1944636 RepID=UPI000C14B5B7|nr:nitrilase family protein [Parabacteroides provencensis]
MEPLKIATAQFETRDNDKAYNLSVIREICSKASGEGAQVVAFHECSVCGYTFAKELSREELLAIAEPIPSGKSTQTLISIAKEFNITLLAGFFEKDSNDNIYKAQICVDGNGLKAKYRKLHPFINPHILPGDRYVVFDIKGWKCGILICYDNNIIENVRATKLLGADIIFMPHVTMCTLSPRPGAGLVDPALWEKRDADPTTLRQEFDGLKGRSWLMKWLPARAYDNAVYVVFSNPIGKDYNEIKNGCSMILDPFGDILAECRKLGDDYVTATLIPEKLTQAGGHRYLNARRPELYADIISQPHTSVQKVAWLTEE